MHLKISARPFLTIFFILVITIVSYFLVTKIVFSNFEDSIYNCSLEKENLRFSCYRSTIEKFYGRNTRKFSTWLNSNPQIDFETGDKGDDISYAVFGTNCHTFYHAAGDFVGTHAQISNIKRMRGMGNRTCTDGYIMGLYKRLALKNNFSEEYLKELYESCPESELFWCAHEMGHLLYDKYSYSILKVLDQISKDNYNLDYPQEYKYQTFDSKDADKSFSDCEKMFSEEKRISECYSGIGHDLFLFIEFSEGSYQTAKQECADSDYKEACSKSFVYRIGLNKTAPLFLSDKFDEGNKLCFDVSEEDSALQQECFKGTGRGIGLFFNSQYSSRVISRSEDELNKEISESEKLCEKAASKFVSDCTKEFLDTRLIKKINQDNSSI